MPGGNCVFNPSWLKKDCYKDWLVQDKLKPASNARCSKCLKTFDVRNMGEAALKSHMNGKKHQEQVKPLKKSSSLINNTMELQPETTDQDAGNGDDSQMTVAQWVTPATLTVKDVKPAAIATKNDVLSAEVLWALKICTSHYSHNSSEGSNLLFQRMFPDSDIASAFKCGEMKSAYLINHGIAPHFKSLLSDRLRSGSCEFVLLFDESMNSKTQNKQMDFHVRIWEGQEVRTRYYHSEFMGHATAADMDSVFETATSDLNLSNLLQLSMDGPNVNWKFYDIIHSRLQKERKKSAREESSRRKRAKKVRI